MPRYRVWRVLYPELENYRISIKPPKTEQEIRKLFGVPDDIDVKPILDGRMKNGGMEA